MVDGLDGVMMLAAASASSNSNTNVGLLGESFKYVAPLFGAIGYSAEDAALANPTDKMKGAMTDLGISITDANGEMLPFKDIMDDLRVKFAGLSEEQQAQYAATIFGKEAMSGLLT